MEVFVARVHIPQVICWAPNRTKGYVDEPPNSGTPCCYPNSGAAHSRVSEPTLQGTSISICQDNRSMCGLKTHRLVRQYALFPVAVTNRFRALRKRSSSFAVWRPENRDSRKMGVRAVSSAHVFVAVNWLWQKLRFMPKCLQLISAPSLGTLFWLPFCLSAFRSLAP
ncbi:hypothetical protein K470DRAFT_9578 [Piedraia hortae CBS 480.64]|uniref:Uncharacterized protein n=1 Tax=Piedraia hortae CBS 480.64 TaxID=1314780 RepID=A0A6A7C476_9PEZI|nr:hypothetical protein K470DRAFT_9578 [Piedraia hortae CBS 480.64]